MQLELVIALDPEGEEPDRPEDGALGRALEATRQGFARVWLEDAAPRGPGDGDPRLLLALAWLAARAPEADLGLRTAIPESLHPLRLSEELAALDLLTGGRLAWAASGRGDTSILAEQLGIVSRALRGERFAHAGEAFAFPEIQCFPRPGSGDGPPLWIAAPDCFAWAAQVGLPIWCEGPEIGTALAAHRAALDGAGTEAHERGPRVVCELAPGANDPGPTRDALVALAERLELSAVVCRIPAHGAEPPDALQQRLAEQVLPELG